MANPSKAKSPKVKTKKLFVRMTADQERLIDQKAEECGVRRSVWARSILMQAARSKAQQGYMRIREPDGANT